MLLTLKLFLQFIKIFYCLPADFYNFLHVDGIGSTLSGFEGDVDEFYSFFVVNKVGSEHNVWDVEIFWKLVDVFGYQFSLHQAVWRIGVGNLHAENNSEKETYYVFYELSRLAVAADGTGADYGVVAATLVPEGLEFVRVRLSIGISLKNVVCFLLDGVAVSIEDCGAVTSIWLINGHKKRSCGGAFL